MRPGSDVAAEAWVLMTGEGRTLLAEVGAVARPVPADLARWRRRAPAERVAAAVRLAESRRRGAAKFRRAEAMWLEPTGLEQATAEPVARHKARRFAEVGGDGLVVDLCTGVGGDALALAGRGPVLAVDSDSGMCRRCLWNATVYGVADRLAAVRARAERFAIPPGALVHIDPDRRAGPSPRARALRDLAPGLELLRALPGLAPGGAMKLSPVSDVEAHFAKAGFELEVISLAGECKEVTVWFGRLAAPGCHRRATKLPGGATWTDRDGPVGPGSGRESAPVDPCAVGPWVFEPDPALVRAGLLDRFAGAHGLRRVGPGIGLLSGPGRLATPWLAAFEVVEVLPIDLKRLRRAVADRRLGPLEIKVRGIDLRPEQVRTHLRPDPDRGNPASLLLIGGPGAAARLAILARRSRAGAWGE